MTRVKTNGEVAFDQVQETAEECQHSGREGNGFARSGQCET